MRALHHKLWRDLWQLRGQSLAITAVLASGVACYLMFMSTLDSLLLSRDLYYSENRFAEIFVPIKRAPESVARRLRMIDGVDKVDTRVMAPLTIDIEGFREPVVGTVTSIPDHGEPLLNRLYLRAGRSIEQGHNDEIIISEAFAKAHAMNPGDRLGVIINGKRKQLRIVGTGGSPEFIHQLRPGGMFPDYERYGILWMGRTALANAYDMEGAFNYAVLTLTRDADEQGVIDRIDDILKPYGGIGAFAREYQPSHQFLAQELDQLENLSGLFPIIFLGVAAFLLHTVVTRLVSTQREQIAALKAFGYSNVSVSAHYLQLIMLIVLAGIVLGIAAGAWLGTLLSAIYVEYFRLPFLRFELHPLRIAQASVITIITGLLGTLAAVRAIARLKPAEAMRPVAPARYHTTLIEELGFQRLLSTPTRMILRNLGHKPVKSLMSILGIALAVGMLMTGRFQENTINYMMDVHYGLSQREDLAVGFSEATSRRALTELESLRGVDYGEPVRNVPARLRYQHREYRVYISAFEPGAIIKRLVDSDLNIVELPGDGIVLNDYLAREILHIESGQPLTVEILEGSMPIRQIPVTALIRQDLGVGAYMDLDALNRLIGDGDVISGAYLYIDEKYADEIYRHLKERPRVVGSVIRTQEIENFHRTMDESMLFWTFVATLFAVVIAVGVVYNSARITLTERSRELASLRVLGYTRGEISYILLGELALLTLVAMPPGLWFGRALCGYIASSIGNEMYRVPLVLEPATYAFAALVVLVASAVSALLVRRRLDALDLIEVLKTKD
ncbi:ABC transporter permease [Mangrovimicrobium sediminis]|uniref:ABC transporter permease n=1 Tax=Mangrovimicrobium sediminis TaxID=2562682 RepID=A0A4Z0LWK8_9GAMM|nr:ABC transporter permease [Haliea sp. SAOS-164]TGD71557.1 ABC transporter permease [Haliea sp. SAOS-164]